MQIRKRRIKTLRNIKISFFLLAVYLNSMFLFQIACFILKFPSIRCLLSVALVFFVVFFCSVAGEEENE